MEEKTIRKPSKNNFSLTKVKLVKDGGLDVHYEVTDVIDDCTYVNKYHVESTQDQHPDLTNCFKAMRPIMARLYNVTSVKTLVETKEFAATKEQMKFAYDFADEAAGKIEMRGVSFSGKNDNAGCVITGLFEFSNGQKSAINSPRIVFSSESFGFEEALEEICAKLEEEVYNYLFCGKKAQLDLFGADGEAANGE